MYFFRLNIKNIFLLKLTSLIVSYIIPNGLIYGYELCEIKEDCFFNEKFDKEISFKNKPIDPKSLTIFLIKEI